MKGIQLLTIVLLAVALNNASGFVALSSDITDRDTKVQVAEDNKNGIINIDRYSSVDMGSQSEELVRINNNLDQDITISIRLLTDADWELYSSMSKKTLSSGESNIYTVDMSEVTKGDKGEYTVIAQNDNLIMEADRSVEFIDPFDYTSGPDVVGRIENRGLDSHTCSEDRNICRNTTDYNLDQDSVPGFVYTESNEDMNSFVLDDSDIGGAVVMNTAGEISGVDVDDGHVGGDVILRAHGKDADIDVDLSEGATIDGDLIVVGDGYIDLVFDPEETDIKGDMKVTVPQEREFESDVVNSVRGDISKDASTNLSEP